MVTKNKYRKRIIDQKIQKLLSAPFALQIVGPRYSGKTTTAMHFCKSMINLQENETSERYKQIAKEDISLLLEGEKPRLVDEWQEIPGIRGKIRHLVDNLDYDHVEYILTGSVVPAKLNHNDIAPGRYLILRMHLMSLYELGISSGEISLNDLVNQKIIKSTACSLTRNDIAKYIVQGGWPNISNHYEIYKDYVNSYIKEICDDLISRYDGVKRNSKLTLDILTSYARLLCGVSKSNTVQSIINDLAKKYKKIAKTTIYSYLRVLKNLFIIDGIKCWNPNFRSSIAFCSSEKKMFIDPSIPARLLKMNDQQILHDPNTMGFLFENLVARDLRAYLQNTDSELYFFRDQKGTIECDYVISYENGEYALVEVKVSSNNVQIALDSLLNVYNKLQKAKIKQLPKFMLIITGDGAAYTIKKDTPCPVHVIPIGCLKD